MRRRFAKKCKDRLAEVTYYYDLLYEFHDIATEENSRKSCLSTVTKGTFKSFAVAINSQSYAEQWLVEARLRLHMVEPHILDP